MCFLHGDVCPGLLSWSLVALGGVDGVDAVVICVGHAGESVECGAYEFVQVGFADVVDDLFWEGFGAGHDEFDGDCDGCVEGLFAGVCENPGDCCSPGLDFFGGFDEYGAAVAVADVFF